MWRERRIRIELPDDADVALDDLETMLDFAVEKVPRYGTPDRAIVERGVLYVVFRVPVDPVTEKKSRPKEQWPPRC